MCVYIYIFICKIAIISAMNTQLKMKLGLILRFSLGSSMSLTSSRRRNGHYVFFNCSI